MQNVCVQGTLVTTATTRLDKRPLSIKVNLLRAKEHGYSIQAYKAHKQTNYISLHTSTPGLLRVLLTSSDISMKVLALRLIAAKGQKKRFGRFVPQLAKPLAETRATKDVEFIKEGFPASRH
jgi:hypothetical protein